MSAQFNILPSDPAVVRLLQQELGFPRFVAETLSVRGIDSVEAAQHFLNPSLDTDWLNPYIIPGLSDVADALEPLIKEEKHIVVFGDFDLDGISATALLTRGLRKLGARVTPFIPLRFKEGYSLTAPAVERLLKLEPDFVVTVDCGIAAKEEAPLITQAGVGFAVTDHHEPADLVPEGVPVADPKISGDCPSSILAGAGVALKLVQVLGARFGQPHMWREYTDLATLGTIADLMPMRDENRALVADGINYINNRPRPCIAALLAVAGAHDKPVSSTNLSYSIIPRLNASGRMGDAQLALDLLLADDFEEATQLANQLEAVNDQRRTIEAELSEIALDQASKVYEGQRVLVVAGEGWHEGVKGIVASRLVNKYGVPVLLFTIDGGEARGSGRSVGQVNLFKAVEAQDDLVIRFGGHEAAVGVTLPAENLEEFTHRLSVYMNNLPAESFHPRIEIDSCVDLAELTIDNVNALQLLAPFGQENRVPKLLARDVALVNCRPVGADKTHLSCMLSDGCANVAGIMFHCPNIKALLDCRTVVNAAFEVQVDEWRGRKSVKAMISALVPAQACACLEACLNPEALRFLSGLYKITEARMRTNFRHQANDLNKLEKARMQNRAHWQQYALEQPEKLEEAIVKKLIGDRTLHESQREILDALDEGKSVLGVMATGRGKSLTFYVHSVKMALATNKASLFIYPLRALISDQAFHISEALQMFGITGAVLTGESSPDDRKQVFAALKTGELDIILTTPEFLTYHIDRFVDADRVGFVAIDESHHIGLSAGSGRAAYAALGTTLERLGHPTVLALTATANSDIADAIASTLHIDQFVLDETVRENLYIDDQRNIKTRETYLANLIATGEKTVIYVNSREKSVTLARELRKLVPQMASLIGFYNAGLSRDERKRIEYLFRTDALCVLVATSAFGEGIDIPNIRHVVLYHLPFSEVEFNQMSGRAGRDGATSTIHLLFGKNDAQLNEDILKRTTPDHDCMAQIYRELKRIQSEHSEKYFTITEDDLAELASKRQRFPVVATAAACGVTVFSELGLIETRISFSAGNTKLSIHVRENAAKVELVDSVRYREGIGEQEIFHIFRDWALSCAPETLQSRISRPILPHDRFDLTRGDQNGRHT